MRWPVEPKRMEAMRSRTFSGEEDVRAVWEVVEVRPERQTYGFAANTQPLQRRVETL